MKDEIKEILEALRDSIDDTGTDKVNFINWVDKIENCITNLQEENERLKEERQNINNRNYNQKIANRKLMEDIEKLRINLKTNKRRRKKQTHKKNIYKSRNEKAIELINAWLEGLNNDDIIILLNDLGNVLQGNDKDE